MGEMEVLSHSTPQRIEEIESYTIEIRDAGPEDIPGLVKVEQGVPVDETMWSKREFGAVIDDTAVLGGPKLIVAVLRGVVLGYVFCQPYEKCEVITSLVVHKDWRRLSSTYPQLNLPYGVGTYLVRAVKYLAQARKKYRVATFVREENLVGQLFLRKNGFLCKEIIEDLFKDPPGTGYRFVYKDGRADEN